MKGKTMRKTTLKIVPLLFAVIFLGLTAFAQRNGGSKTVTATLAASPAAIVAGQSSTLTWTTTNATTATLNNAPVALDGSLSVTPTATTTYVLTASSKSGSVQKSATVSVTPKPNVTLLNPNKLAWDLNPSNGGNNVFLTGSGFAQNMQVWFGDMPEPGSIYSANGTLGYLVTPVTNPENVLGSVDVTVTNPGPPVASMIYAGAFTFTQSVSISPGYGSVGPGQQIQYSATVKSPTGLTADQTVVWSATGGTIDQNGLWTAPSDPNAQSKSYTISATSNAAPSGTGQAGAELCNPTCP